MLGHLQVSLPPPQVLELLRGKVWFVCPHVRARDPQTGRPGDWPGRPGSCGPWKAGSPAPGPGTRQTSLTCLHTDWTCPSSCPHHRVGLGFLSQPQGTSCPFFPPVICSPPYWGGVSRPARSRRPKPKFWAELCFSRAQKPVVGGGFSPLQKTPDTPLTLGPHPKSAHPHCRTHQVLACLAWGLGAKS